MFQRPERRIAGCTKVSRGTVARNEESEVRTSQPKRVHLFLLQKFHSADVLFSASVICPVFCMFVLFLLVLFSSFALYLFSSFGPYLSCFLRLSNCTGLRRYYGFCLSCFVVVVSLVFILFILFRCCYTPPPPPPPPPPPYKYEGEGGYIGITLSVCPSVRL